MGGKLFPGSDIVAERWRTVGTTYRFGLSLIGLGMAAAFAFGALTCGGRRLQGQRTWASDSDCRFRIFDLGGRRAVRAGSGLQTVP